jgi:peptide/nickel transport system permease protein
MNTDVVAVAASPADKPLRSRSPWPAFAARRLGRLAIGIIVVVTLSFLVMQLVAGDPVRLALGPTAPVSLVNAKRHELGLDQPLLVQYLHYWQHVLSGDLGTSIVSQQRVSSIISARVWDTVTLVAVALLLTLVCGVVLGVAIGGFTYRGKHPRVLAAFRFVASTFNVIPDFVYGVALVYLFAVTFEILPVAGTEGGKALILPSLAISLGPIFGLARIARVQTEEVLSQEYIQYARSKRLSTLRIYCRHALPNLLTAALTIGGLLLGVLVASTVVVENVFARPGLGSVVVTAIVQRDYPVAQGVLLILGGAVLVVNLSIDVVLSLLDPRSLIRDS